MRLLGGVLTALKSDPLSRAFLEPVDWRAQHLLDYPHIVTNPMDLQTASTKLLQNGYASTEEFWVDMDLIWTNCMSYNIEGSAISNSAKQLLAKSEILKKKFYEDAAAAFEHKMSRNGGRVAKQKDRGGSEGGLDDQEDFVFRAQLCRRISRLDPPNLGKLLKFLVQEQSASVAVAGGDGRRVVVDINALPHRIVKHLMSIVKTLLYQQLAKRQSVSTSDQSIEGIDNDTTPAMRSGPPSAAPSNSEGPPCPSIPEVLDSPSFLEESLTECGTQERGTDREMEEHGRMNVLEKKTTISHGGGRGRRKGNITREGPPTSPLSASKRRKLSFLEGGKERMGGIESDPPPGTEGSRDSGSGSATTDTVVVPGSRIKSVFHNDLEKSSKANDTAIVNSASSKHTNSKNTSTNSNRSRTTMDLSLVPIPKRKKESSVAPQCPLPPPVVGDGQEGGEQDKVKRRKKKKKEDRSEKKEDRIAKRKHTAEDPGNPAILFGDEEETGGESNTSYHSSNPQSATAKATTGGSTADSRTGSRLYTDGSNWGNVGKARNDIISKTKHVSSYINEATYRGDHTSRGVGKLVYSSDGSNSSVSSTTTTSTTSTTTSTVNNPIRASTSYNSSIHKNRVNPFSLYTKSPADSFTLPHPFPSPVVDSSNPSSSSVLPTSSSSSTYPQSSPTPCSPSQLSTSIPPSPLSQPLHHYVRGTFPPPPLPPTTYAPKQRSPLSPPLSDVLLRPSLDDEEEETSSSSSEDKEEEEETEEERQPEENEEEKKGNEADDGSEQDTKEAKKAK